MLCLQVVPSIPMFAVDFLEEADQSTECRKNAAFNLPVSVSFHSVFAEQSSAMYTSSCFHLGKNW